MADSRGLNLSTNIVSRSAFILYQYLRVKATINSKNGEGNNLEKDEWGTHNMASKSNFAANEVQISNPDLCFGIMVGY